MFKKTCAFLVLSALTACVVWDSSFHFDPELLKGKRERSSAQRNWSLHLNQTQVFTSGGLVHKDDFKALEKVIQRNSIVISDKATSYYLASHLPIFVKNVHRHHGRNSSKNWEYFLEDKVLCRLHSSEYQKKLQHRLSQHAKQVSSPEISKKVYWAINLTQGNLNFRTDCLANTRGKLLSKANELAKRVYLGDTIALFELASPARTLQGDHDGS